MRLIWILFALLALGASACGPATSGGGPAATATSPVPATSAATATGPAATATTAAPTLPPANTPEASPEASPAPEVTTVPVPGAPAGLVYTIGAGNGLWRVRADGQAELLTDQHYPVLSPDQTQVLYAIGYEGDIWIHDLPAGPDRQLTNTPEVLEEGFQWWPANPGLIVFGTRPAPADMAGSALATMRSDGSDYQVLDADAGMFDRPALSPDGSTIAYSRGTQPALYRLNGGVEPLDLTAFGLDGRAAASPAWSPDGQKLAWKVYGDGAGDGWSGVAVLDLAAGTGTLLHRYPILGGSEIFAEVVWSPDGQWLAVLNQAEIAGERVSLWALRADGSEEHYLGGNTAAPVWGPDSSRLAYTQWPAESSSFDQGQVLLVTVGEWQPTPAGLPGGAEPEAWLSLAP